MKTRGRLFRKYAILFVGLVAGSLLASGAIEAWFSFQENKAMLVRIQREKAAAAAAIIRQFVREVENQIAWTMHSSFLSGAQGFDQRRIDFLRLLRQAPAITEIALLDPAGREQLRVSRLAMDVVGGGKDFSRDAKFTVARAKRLYLGPVYFRKQSEPYMTIAMAGSRRSAGVTVAEVNLKFIRWAGGIKFTSILTSLSDSIPAPASGPRRTARESSSRLESHGFSLLF